MQVKQGAVLLAQGMAGLELRAQQSDVLQEAQHAPPWRVQSQPALRNGEHPTEPEGVVMASRCESPPLVPGVHTNAQALMSQLASQPAAQNRACARRNLCCFLHHGRHSRLSGAPETILPPLSLTLFHHP